MAMLKLIVDFGPLLIRAEGTKSSKMHSYFLGAMFIEEAHSMFSRKRESSKATQSFTPRKLPDRQRSLSSWRGNQQASLTEPLLGVGGLAYFGIDTCIPKLFAIST